MTNAWREDICRVGASLDAHGLVPATAGNISVRTDTGFLITPSDACLGHLDPACRWWMARLAPLRPAQIDALRAHFSARW